MEQQDLSEQLQQTHFVDLGRDDQGAPIRVHRYTPVKIGRDGEFGVMNRVTEEIVADGFSSFGAAQAASKQLMSQEQVVAVVADGMTC